MVADVYFPLCYPFFHPFKGIVGRTVIHNQPDEIFAGLP
jgi:hypothetical protein